MASLSLPRVLQQRKTSLELERENFEKFQAISIGKAINQIENPVKEKHVRSTIIGTFHEKGGGTFWVCVLRLPLQDNRIVAWKFCHVLHKVLREGHPLVVPNSQRYRGTIEDLGKLWCHLKEGYGKLIKHYTQLLISKLDFHRRNPRFPGNMQVTKEELENIGENDINNYFQMSVEMFDYMDEILNLQAAIFGSLDMSRSNSMTSSGQCRLAPLIPCIQDSSQLYDYCVKILFKLHASLPPDTLAGHRERFLKQFRELRQFYLNATTMQYFKTLIQIPHIPETPPNFLVQSDLRSYVTPVVILPPEESVTETDSMDGSLVDTSDNGSATGDLVDLTHRNGSISPDVLAERDNLIEHLQQEISRLRTEIQRLLQEHQRVIRQLNEKIMDLETQLATKSYEDASTSLGEIEDSQDDDPGVTEVHDVFQEDAQRMPHKQPLTFRERRAMDSGVDAIVETMKVVGDNLNNRKTPDEFTCFGNFVASQLHKMQSDNYLVAITKKEINEVLFKSDLEFIRKTRPSTEASIFHLSHTTGRPTDTQLSFNTPSTSHCKPHQSHEPVIPETEIGYINEDSPDQSLENAPPIYCNSYELTLHKPIKD